jgi:hypothetical protein
MRSHMGQGKRVTTGPLVLGLVGLVCLVVAFGWAYIAYGAREELAPAPIALGLEAPPEREGTPLAWIKRFSGNFSQSSDGIISISAVIFEATNMGAKEVVLQSAFVVSRKTGDSLELKVGAGSEGWLEPREINPIPPTAVIQLSSQPAPWGVGLVESEFRAKWGDVDLVVTYDGMEHRINYGEKLIDAAFANLRPKPIGPHITKRRQN